MNLDIFNRETTEPSSFFFENVSTDNACFYRAVSNCIKYNFSKLTNGVVDLNYEEQTKFAQDIQYTCYKWVEKNQKKIMRIGVDNDLEVSLEELIKMTHNISLQTYLVNYKNFSGSLVFNDDLEILSNRWGGYIEQLAISESLRQPIIIFSLQKFNTESNKINFGRFTNNKPYKNTRLKILQVIGLKYIRNNNNIIVLLWRKNTLGEHYISVYPKNTRNFIRYITDNFSLAKWED